tara:strand:+ start:66 stop:374 length:309 start_codon:yes stop_codon:yes gene_type:complete
MTIDRLIKPVNKGLYKEITTGPRKPNSKWYPIKGIDIVYIKDYYLSIDLCPMCRHESMAYKNSLMDKLIACLNIKEIERKWIGKGDKAFRYYGVIIKCKRVT